MDEATPGMQAFYSSPHNKGLVSRHHCILNPPLFSRKPPPSSDHTSFALGDLPVLCHLPQMKHPKIMHMYVWNLIFVFMKFAPYLRIPELIVNWGSKSPCQSCLPKLSIPLSLHSPPSKVFDCSPKVQRRHWAPLGATSHNMDSHRWSLSSPPFFFFLK
jgi:hypothetical protein